MFFYHQTNKAGDLNSAQHTLKTTNILVKNNKLKYNNN